ncbi:ParA family protein [Mesorhizobium sp.]|uniref:ParA family protein n=1 Tax=Mesorhizobium sp. TaxID=1871066 RepID=UPI000FE85A50|nr:ParA family protein [Mesorhizobium sp.]RWJ01276.1 MAG: ParA family protein [Mesorhizobium sp.]
MTNGHVRIVLCCEGNMLIWYYVSMMTCFHVNIETTSAYLEDATMIISAAIPKGGTGKSTLLRTLASVALHRGYSVTLIDGDQRQNMSRWFQMLDDAGNRPDKLKLVSATSPQDILEAAGKHNGERSVVLIDTEGTTNDNLMAGLFASDIVVVPVYFALDDVTAAIQITDHYIPLAVETRGRPLPAIFVLTKQTIIDGRARALTELRAIIQANGTPIAEHVLHNRVAYRDLQTGQTLYSPSEPDAKAIAESEGVFDDVLQTFIEATRHAA